MSVGSLLQLPGQGEERKAWQQELGAAAHIISTGRKHKVVNNDVQLTWLLFTQLRTHGTVSLKVMVSP